VKKMSKTLPSPLVQSYKVWSRQDIHSLIGEMINISKQRPNQTQGENCRPGSQLEKAVDRFALFQSHFQANFRNWILKVILNRKYQRQFSKLDS